jgi:cytochrome c5
MTPSPRHRKRFAFAFLALLPTLLAGCGERPATAAHTPAVAANALSPELKAIYARSCATCHAVPATGAPQAGDAAAWAPRIAQGEDVLLDHTINGFNAMPPMGACADCDEAQYRALIAYMAGTGRER